MRERYHCIGGNDYRLALYDLLDRDGYICGICGNPLPQDHSQIHVDHRVPVSKGLKMGWTKEKINYIENLQPAHPDCNLRKHATWDGTMPGEKPLQRSLFDREEE